MDLAPFRDDLLKRFLRYVELDTQADEHSLTIPSTAKQIVLSRMLAEECQQMGLTDVELTEHGLVYATIPATVEHSAPTIAWVAHVDTSSEFAASNIKPVLHENYQGGDLVLPGDPQIVITEQANPELLELRGATLITTDGTTLLGADDKAGIACIMTAAQALMADRSLPCGEIRVCFTVDEEIGRGTDELDFEKLNSTCAYTLDSSGRGRIDTETFSADLAIITVKGVNTHPSEGKDKIVNAIKWLSRFVEALPADSHSPETTEGRDGFIHPYSIEGGVAQASCRMILRDFETPVLDEYRDQLQQIANQLMQQESRLEITVEIRRQYRNMRDGLDKEPRAIPKAIAATEAAGLTPVLDIIRGGTDGSLMTEKGLPTPNLSSGQHNPHGPTEWTSVEEMLSSTQVLIQLAHQWSKEQS